MSPLVITVEDTRTRASARYSFVRSPVHLGRGEDNDIALPYPVVSARHGLIQFDADEVRYTDLGSLNGSALDGVALSPDIPTRVPSGSELRIGVLRITCSFGAAARRFEVTAPAVPTTSPQGAVDVLMERLARAPEGDPSEAWAASLRPGMVIGRFELQREVGRGGFGVVFQARDRQLGRLVAFKALRVRSKGSMGLREDLLWREAETAARLNHPNIVTLFDVGVWAGGPYLVLELLEGESLEVRIGRGRLELGEASRVAIDVARALAHAHGAGVVHGDLKPSNVFITRGGWAKVLDFGLAQVMGAERVLAAGTPHYMAPEQQARGTRDGRTDVYAAALISAEMIFGAGRGAVAGGLRGEVRGAPGLAELLRQALADEPARRPADGSAWLKALLEVQRAVRQDERASAAP